MIDDLLSDYDEFAFAAAQLAAAVRALIQNHPFQTGQLEPPLKKFLVARRALFSGANNTTVATVALMAGKGERTVQRILKPCRASTLNTGKQGTTGLPRRRGKYFLTRSTCLPRAHAQFQAEASQEKACSEKTEAP